MRRLVARVTESKGRLVTCQIVSGSGKPSSQKKQIAIVQLSGIGRTAGSLNLRVQHRIWLRRSAAIKSPYGPLFTAELGRIPVVFRPYPSGLRYGVPPHELHVYSDVKLRDLLGLSDGDTVYLNIRAATRFAPVDTLILGARRTGRVGRRLQRSLLRWCRHAASDRSLRGRSGGS